MSERGVTTIPKEDAQERKVALEDAMADALRVLRSHCGELDDGQRKRLREIIDRAERDGDHYTVLYTLMVMEISLRETRERLAECLDADKFIDKRY